MSISIKQSFGFSRVFSSNTYSSVGGIKITFSKIQSFLFIFNGYMGNADVEYSLFDNSHHQTT